MKNLLVAVDFSDVTDRVVATAEQMARAFGAKIWLTHVVAEASPMASLGEVPFQWPAIDAESPERFPEEQHQMQVLLFGLVLDQVAGRDHLLDFRISGRRFQGTDGKS